MANSKALSRFAGGISTAEKAETLGMFQMPDPTKYHVYFNDFDTYVAGDWTITEVGAGTRALTDVDGGALLITNAGVEDDHNYLNKKGESFLFTTGKSLFFKARFKVSHATQSDFVIGLQTTDTTPLDARDGVFFQKDDGDTNLDFHVEKDDVATDATAIHTIVADTFLTVGFYYDGRDKIRYYVNDVQKGTLAITNMPDDEELTTSIAIENGDGNARSLTLDFVFVARER